MCPSESKTRVASTSGKSGFPRILAEAERGHAPRSASWNRITDENRTESDRRPARPLCIRSRFMAFPYAPQPVPSWWPVYGAVNVFGSLAIAGFFQGLAAGNPNTDAFTIGLVVKMTLVPVLGVLAYRDLFDRFPSWARIPVAGAPILPAPVRVAPRRVFTRHPRHAEARPLPPPPSPENTMRPLPPPPTD